MPPTITESAALDRLRALCDDGQHLVSVVATGADDARRYYATIRVWDHPDADGLRVLCIQNAQLVAEWSDMSDTFLSGSYRQRFAAGDGDVARALASALAGTAAQIDGETVGTRETGYSEP